MVKIFDQSFSGTKTGASSTQANFEVTGSITGVVLITELYLELSNVDVNNSDDNNNNTTAFKIESAHRYLDQRPSNDLAIQVDVDSASSDFGPDVSAGSSATYNGPFHIPGSVVERTSKNIAAREKKIKGTYVQDGMHLGLSIVTSDPLMSFNGSFDWKVRLAGRKML